MRTLVTILVMAIVLSPVTASAIDVYGDQWGTWTRDNSPYNVVGEIRVPPESTLVIEPGVLVNFQGHCKFIVDSLATLYAAGTESDSIIFTAEQPNSGWHGIRFLYADSTCQISHCRLEYGSATGSYPDFYGGAIYCYYSSPTINSNTISNNSADSHSGAIHCCFRSSPTITNNAIVGNSSGHSGGGIGCVGYYSRPTIYNNYISDNLATFGGGIVCYENSSPVIGHNTIVGNLAGDQGGGIYCYGSSDATISHNTISDNWAYRSGGGISCAGSGTTVSHNIISGNSVSGYEHPGGGGIHCLSDATIDNNTISGNRVSGEGGCGGGIFCDASNPIITNTIVWGNVASWGPEIDEGGGNPIVAYCDVRGGFPGQGILNCDPLFRDSANGDFQITWQNYPEPDTTKSCCIDAGDPSSLLDPDGTRADIGALYFHQHGVQLFCQGLSRVFCRGGRFNFKIIVDNNTGNQVSGILAFTAYSNYHCDPTNTLLTIQRTKTYPPGVTEEYYFMKVPYAARPGKYSASVAGPLGDYELFCCMNARIKECSPWKIGNNTEWELVEVGRSETERPLPTVTALSQNYPNPFNASTVIGYQLREASDVKLELYNLIGERVATLVDSKQQPGYRSVTWDASEASSGLYFYKLTAGDFTETKRMMLVK